MAPQVGFKNTAEEEHGGAARKKSTSPALIISFLACLIVIGVYGGVKMWLQRVKQENSDIQKEIAQIETTMQSTLSVERSDFIARTNIIKREMNIGYDPIDILTEIERGMVKKESDGSGNRVVLTSFSYAGEGGEKSNTGNVAGEAKVNNGIVEITGNADTFDVMAQQIEVFKKSDFFENVSFGSTDRDNSGRITFAITMDVKPHKKKVYDKEVKNENRGSDAVADDNEEDSASVEN